MAIYLKRSVSLFRREINCGRGFSQLASTTASSNCYRLSNFVTLKRLHSISSKNKCLIQPQPPTNLENFKKCVGLTVLVNKFPLISTKVSHDSQSRCFTTTSVKWKDENPPESNDRYIRGIRLMDFPDIIWPSFLYTIKNWILAKLIIQPYLDKEFTLDDFARGAKQAILHVSSLLSNGKLDVLKGLVTDDALTEVKRNYSLLDMQQRHKLAINESDIYFSFPYQVGIMLDDSSGAQKRFVEITMCYHCLLGNDDLKKVDPSMSEIYKYKENIIVCNFRFIKEFTKGKESDWIINVVNYFQPAAKT